MDNNNTHRGVSIIMPCFNAGEFLDEAISSVLSHIDDSIPFEIILVDDGSGKETKDIVQRLAAENYPFLNVFSLEKNIGQSAARNFAIKQSQFDYILPIDADDMLNIDPAFMNKHESYPARAIKELEVNENLALVFSGGQQFGAVDRPLIFRSFSPKTLLLYGGLPVYTVFRKDDFEATRGFDESLDCIEDWAFNISLINGRFKRNLGIEVQKFPEPYYLYRQHTHGQNVNSRARDMPKFLNKIFENDPEIYRHVFSGKTDDEIKTMLMDVPKYGQVKLAFEIATQHPKMVPHYAAKVIGKLVRSFVPENSVPDFLKQNK